jgi:hypothetical protein
MVSFMRIRLIVGGNWTNRGPTLLSLRFTVETLVMYPWRKKSCFVQTVHYKQKSHGLVFPQESFNVFCGCISSSFWSYRVCQTSYPVAEVRRSWVIFFVHSSAGFLFVYLCDILAVSPHCSLWGCVNGVCILVHLATVPQNIRSLINSILKNYKSFPLPPALLSTT